MEAAFVNFVRPGDVVVVGVNGVFGERMCEVADRLGAEVVRVDAAWGEPLDPGRARGRPPGTGDHRRWSTPRPRPACATTSRRSVAEKGDALLLVDTVTSLGGIEVAVDDWGVDIAYSGTQKCLGVPPGLAPLTVSTAGGRAPGGAAVELVPRPEPHRQVRQRACGRRPYLPPHRARGHGGRPARRAGCPAGRGRGGGPGSGTRRAASCCRTGSKRWDSSSSSPREHRLPQLTTVQGAGTAGRRGEAAVGACCSTITGSRSAPEPASWRVRSGASAAWGTRRGGATW